MQDPTPPPHPASVHPLPLQQFLFRNRVFFIGFLVFMLTAAYFLLTTQQGELEIAINRFRSPLNDRVVSLITKLAEEEVYILGALVLAAINYRKAISFAILGILVGVSSGLLKGIFASPRPMRWFFDYAQESWEQLFRFEETASSWAYTSFPSGHATSAFAIYGFLAFSAGKKHHLVGLVCISCAVLVAFSRQYLLFHFLKDVTAGAALGLTLAILVYFLQDRIFPSSQFLDRGFLRRSPLA